MAPLSPIPRLRHMPIKLLSLRIILWFASAVVCAWDRPVELDLISQLANRKFTSPVDISLGQQPADSHLTLTSEPSDLLSSFRSHATEELPTPDLQMHDATVYQQHLHQVPDILSRGRYLSGPDLNAIEAMVTQSPLLNQNFQSSPNDAYILNSSHQRKNLCNIAEPNTRNEYHHRQSYNDVNASTLSLPLHGLDGQFLEGGEKSGIALRSDPESLANDLSAPPNLIMGPIEYLHFRSEALFKVQTISKAFRFRDFRLASKTLGALEIHKLGLKKELDNIVDTLRIKWVRDNLMDVQDEEELEFQNKHRIGSIEYAVMTSMYFMSVLNEICESRVIRSQELLQKSQKEGFEFLKGLWLSLDLKGQSEASRLISGIRKGCYNKKMKVLWLTAAMCFQKKMPEAYKVLKGDGDYQLHKISKVWLMDKTLIAGVKLKLFDTNPGWDAISSINVRLRTPPYNSRFYEETANQNSDSSLSSPKRKRDDSDDGMRKTKAMVSGPFENPEMEIQGEKEISRIMISVPSQRLVQKPTQDHHYHHETGEGGGEKNLPPRISLKISQSSNNEKESINRLRCNLLTCHKESCLETELNPGKNDEPCDLKEGHHLYEYQGFRKENFHCGEIKRGDRRKYLHSELQFLGQGMIDDLGLKEDESIFHRCIRDIIKRKCIKRNKTLSVEYANKNRINAISFATRATLYYIKALNRIYSKKLYPTEALSKKAQKEGFECVANFFETIYETPEISISDILARSAFDKLDGITSGASCEGLHLSWISFSYWIREILPPDIYVALTDGPTLNRDMKWLIGDVILAEGYKTDINNQLVQQLEAHFDTEFILKLPV